MFQAKFSELNKIVTHFKEFVKIADEQRMKTHLDQKINDIEAYKLTDQWRDIQQAKMQLQDLQKQVKVKQAQMFDDQPERDNSS